MNAEELEKIFFLMKKFKITKLECNGLYVEKTVHEQEVKAPLVNEELENMKRAFAKDLPPGSILNDPDLYAAING
jgi:hypothetical protein